MLQVIEGLGTHAPRMKLFTDGWMPLGMNRKRQMIPLRVEPHYRPWMNTTWNKWNLSLNIHVQQLLQKLESLQQVFAVSSPTPGETNFVQSAFHKCRTMTKECVLVATTHLQHWRNEGNAFLNHILALTCDGSIHLTISWNGRMLNGMPKHYQGRKLHAAIGVLWKPCTSCSSAKMGLC